MFSTTNQRAAEMNDRCHCAAKYTWSISRAVLVTTANCDFLKIKVFTLIFFSKPTCILQSGVSERAAVTAVLIGEVGPGVVRAHRAVIGRVSQWATVRGCARGEGPVVLGGPDGVQPVDRIMVVGQAGGGLLVSGVAVTAKLQKRRFGRIRRDQSVRYRAHSHHWGEGQ